MVDKKTARRGLGRGLSALMADVKDDAESHKDATSEGGSNLIPIEKILPNPDQPRRNFVVAELDDLAASIREKGIIQPLILRKNAKHPGSFEIVAGERRWRAAQIAQLHEVPAIVRDYDDAEVLEIAIVENVQRADLNPAEEAAGYRQLVVSFGYTQEKLASVVGKSRPYIANLLRLLTLPDEVLVYVREGKLSAGHARALVTAENPVELARRVVKQGLSVREIERLARAKTPGKKNGASVKREKDADTRALEADLSANLGMKVIINHTANAENGTLTISYKSLNQLDDLCQIITSAPTGS